MARGPSISEAIGFRLRLLAPAVAPAQASPSRPFGIKPVGAPADDAGPFLWADVVGPRR